MEKITPKVSIIIPAYNSEKYIREMLNSIMNQTYQNIEVIIAYDTKSNDTTLEILNYYEEISPFNFIIDKANDSSIGEARNRGYQFATGDLIIFLDSDDYISQTMIEDYSKALIENSNCDISTGKYCVHWQKRKLKKQLTMMKTQNEKKLSYKFISPAYVFNKIWDNYKYSNASWNYMLRKSLIDNHNITYPNLSHGEDQIFMITCLKNARKIATCNHYGYMYIVHETSISHKDLDKKDAFLKKHEMFFLEYEKILGIDFPTISMMLKIEYIIRNLLGNIYLPLPEFLKNTREKGIYKIPVPPYNWKLKWITRLFNINPVLFYHAYKIYKRLRY